MQRPINRAALANMRDQLPYNGFQRRLTEYLYGAVVHFQCIIKGNYVICKTEILAALVTFSHPLGEFDQFCNDLSRFNGAVLVTADRTLSSRGKGASVGEYDVSDQPKATPWASGSSRE